MHSRAVLMNHVCKRKEQERKDCGKKKIPVIVLLFLNICFRKDVKIFLKINHFHVLPTF